MRGAGMLVAIALVSAAALALYPPLHGVGRGEVGVRINRLTGSVGEWGEGSVLVLPGLHQMRVFSLRDRTWRAAQMSHADGPAPLQSVEGLSLGADLTVRYAIDPLKVAALARSLPDNVAGEIVEPATQGVVYKVFARYAVREIFSTKRAEIQAAIETELKPRLAVDGIVLRNMPIRVAVPPERSAEKLCSAVAFRPMHSNAWWTPPLLSSTTRLAMLSPVDASSTSVAPKRFASSSLKGSLSTAMMRAAPAMWAALIVARPMPPAPNTATVEPGSTLAVWTTAP